MLAVAQDADAGGVRPKCLDRTGPGREGIKSGRWARDHGAIRTATEARVCGKAASLRCVHWAGDPASQIEWKYPMTRPTLFGRCAAPAVARLIKCLLLAAALGGCTQGSGSPAPSPSTAGIVTGFALGGRGPAGGGIASSSSSFVPLQLNVYPMDGKQVLSVQLDQNRRYKVQLPVGKYTLDVPGRDVGSCDTAVWTSPPVKPQHATSPAPRDSALYLHGLTTR